MIEEIQAKNFNLLSSKMLNLHNIIFVGKQIDSVKQHIDNIEQGLAEIAVSSVRKPSNYAALKKSLEDFKSQFSENHSVSKSSTERLIKRLSDLSRSSSISRELDQHLRMFESYLVKNFAHELNKEKLFIEGLDNLEKKQIHLETLTDKSLRDISTSVKNVLRKLDNKSTSLEKSLDSLLASGLESATNQISEVKAQSITEIDNNLEVSLRSSIKNAKEDVLSTLKLEAGQAEENIKQIKESAISEVKDEVKQLSKSVSEHIDEFIHINNALRKTLNFVASDALSDVSFKQANDEKKTADILRGCGILWTFCSLVIFFATFEFKDLLDSNEIPNYSLILLRSFLLVAGMSPAFYLLRESARHRTDERRYRQKGIQLATIDGYFAEHDKIEKNKIKSDLSKLYFNGDDHYVDVSSVDKIQSGYDKVYDAFLNQATKRKAQR
ncbi:hypothetical protein AB4476_21705 [Vibrio splendidus]